jgi:hypothetical protein
MPRWLRPRGLLDIAGALGLGAIGFAWLISLALAGVYRPATPSGWADAAPVSTSASDALVVVHTAAAAIAGMAAFAFLLVLVWPTGRAAPWRRRSSIAAAVVATLTCAAAIATRDLLAWEQLALSEVVVGTDLSGYWDAAVDDRVRFVLVDGAEVAQSTYARTLAVHLVSPLIAAAALALAIVSVRRVTPGGN